MKIFGEINFPSCYAAKAHTQKSHCQSRSPTTDDSGKEWYRKNTGRQGIPVVSDFPPSPPSILYELDLVGIPENVTDSRTSGSCICSLVVTMETGDSHLT